MLGDLLGHFRGKPITPFRPNLRVRPEDHGHEASDPELRLRATHFACLVPDAPDAGARLLDETDPMQQVGNEGVPPNAPVSKVGQSQPLGQAAGAAHLDSVGVDLDKDVGAVEEPVSVHDGVRDRLAQGLHRILRDVVPPQALDPIGGTSIALDEAHGVFDVRHNPAVEVLAVQDTNLVRALAQQAGDVRLREETAHVPCEEEHARVSEEQLVARPLGDLDVDQHVLDWRSSGDAGLAEPDVELVVVEILRIAEPGTG